MKRGRLRLTVLLLLGFTAGIAVAGVLFKGASSRAPLLIQTILNVAVLFLLFRIYGAQKSQARGVQQAADSILRKLQDNEPITTEPQQPRRKRPDRIM